MEKVSRSEARLYKEQEYNNYLRETEEDEGKHRKELNKEKIYIQRKSNK